MKNIKEYINEHFADIAYITRSECGSWSISLKRNRNITNQSIMSYQKLTDAELDEIKKLDIVCFDFLTTDNFKLLFSKMENLSKELCY